MLPVALDGSGKPGHDTVLKKKPAGGGLFCF